VQDPLVQSLPAMHRYPVVHRGQSVPPQSTSVSVPFFRKSVQFWG
jgi:hypothetical protein